MKIGSFASFGFFLLLLFCCPSVYSQDASIRGKVTDAATKEALFAATLRVGEQGTTTDLDGNYSLSLAPGSHSIEVSYLGYENYFFEIVLQPDEQRSLNIELNTEATLLQTATVTSGKFEKPLGEVTVSLEVLKPRLIENNNATSVDEVLGKLPGVSIIDGQANVRGGSGYSYGAGSRVLLLVDDIPALQADAGFPNWDDLPVENIEQVEVVKGAASALYGSSALNGIINVRTAYAKSDPITKASAFFTGFMSPKDENKKWWDSLPFESGASFSHAQKMNKLDLVLGGYYLHRNSFREDEQSRYGRFTLSTRYRVNDRFNLGFNGNINAGSSSNYFYWMDGAENAYRGDPSTFSEGNRWRIYIDPYLSYFDKAGNRHKFLGRYYGINNNLNENRSNQSDLFYGEYQFQKQFEDIDLVATAGVVGIATSISAVLYGDANYSSRNFAGFLQLDKKLFERLNLSGGFRYERNTLLSPELVAGDTIPDGRTTEAKPVYRFGLNYQLAKATYLRGSWGQGYRFPTVAEKFITTTLGSTNIIPNPSLTSETGWSTELGIKQGFKLGSFNGFIDVAGFWSEYQDMIEFVIVRTIPPPFQAQNIGNTVIKGIDISLVGQGQIGDVTLNVLAGYTYIDPKFKEFSETDQFSSSVDYNILKYRNKHSVKMDLELGYRSWTFAVAGLYNSHMEAIDAAFEQFIPGLKEYREQDQDGFRVFDLRLSRHFTDKLKLSLLAKNILNEEYTVRPAQLEAPRNITFRADYSF